MELYDVLKKGACPNLIADIVTRFHKDWLQAVSDVEDFRKRVRDTPRDHFHTAIEYTLSAANQRDIAFRNFIEVLIDKMGEQEKHIMKDELRTIHEMLENLTSALKTKQREASGIADSTDYILKMFDEIEELFNWLDMLYDNLAVLFSKTVGMNLPTLTTDLTKTLQQIINDISCSASPDAKFLARKISEKSRSISFVIRLSVEDLEIRKILEKMKTLEGRILRLKSENSPAVMALQQRAMYLEERLMSLEDLQQSLCVLKSKHKLEQEQLKKVHIFDHLLPAISRICLVDDLLKRWQDVLCHTMENNSIISILSVTNMVEVFNDEFGSYTIDMHGRKLYQGNGDILYQLNERNELVPLDDDHHIYFYDDCGRYYYNDKNQRIYRALKSDSEYYMNDNGDLYKLREVYNGKEYWYDDIGRHFINEEGKKIYTDNDIDFYEHDGLGNRVRMRDEEQYYEECPIEPLILEENKYLQRVVGDALKKCIAETILRQPNDPVLYLALSLEKYWSSKTERQKRIEDETELFAEREERMRYQEDEHKIAEEIESVEEEDIDYDFRSYETMEILSNNT